MLRLMEKIIRYRMVKVLEIDADKRNIEINFSSLNHLYAHKVSYAYRLNGEGDTWTKLSPGRNGGLSQSVEQRQIFV